MQGARSTSNSDQIFAHVLLVMLQAIELPDGGAGWLSQLRRLLHPKARNYPLEGSPQRNFGFGCDPDAKIIASKLLREAHSVGLVRQTGARDSNAI